MADREGCTGACPPPPQLQLYQTIIFATPVLFAFMLLLMFCLFYFRRHSRRAASIQSQIRAQIFAESLLATAPLEQGLSTSFRQQLPVILFDDKFKAAYQDSQCAVCLCDYQTNEKLQQLPVCKHSFHVSCISEWLAKNTTCPICRLSLSEVRIGVVDAPGQLDEVCSMQVLLRGADAPRIWEERVVSEAQDHIVQVRATTSDEVCIQDTALSERGISCMAEHTINIERS